MIYQVYNISFTCSLFLFVIIIVIIIDNHFDPISACSLSKALSQCVLLEGFIFNNEYLTDEMGICEVIIAISKIPTIKKISFTSIVLFIYFF